VAHGYEHVDWDIAGWVMGGPLDVFVHDIIHGALDLLCGGWGEVHTHNTFRALISLCREERLLLRHMLLEAADFIGNFWVCEKTSDLILSSHKQK
jgi:hypothetical protein